MNAPNYSRFPGPGDLPGDPNHPNSPDYNADHTDALRDELESLPDFIHEAMGETNPAELARALADDDALALMRIVRKAVSDYADWNLRHSPDSENVTLRRLVRVYRGQVAA